MRRFLAAALLSAGALGVGGVALCANSTGSVIDFENVGTGSIYYVYSEDGEGAFAINGYNEYGNGQAIVVNTPTGHGHMLSVVKPIGCQCTRLDIDLTACDAGYVALQSLKILGTTQPAKIVWLDRGGNSLPDVNGLVIAATGTSGSTTVSTPTSFSSQISGVFVYFENGGSVDDIRFTCPDVPFPPPPPPNSDCDDFFTGGGFLFDTPSGLRGNFGVGGGLKNGAFWGHLNFIDHGSGQHMKGTSVTSYTVTGATSRRTTGTCTVNGVAGFTYTLDIADNGEPGTSDTLKLTVSNGYVANGTIDGGNLQLHKANCTKKN